VSHVTNPDSELYKGVVTSAVDPTFVPAIISTSSSSSSTVSSSDEGDAIGPSIGLLVSIPVGILAVVSLLALFFLWLRRRSAQVKTAEVTAEMTSDMEDKQKNTKRSPSEEIADANSNADEVELPTFGGVDNQAPWWELGMEGNEQEPELPSAIEIALAKSNNPFFAGDRASDGLLAPPDKRKELRTIAADRLLAGPDKRKELPRMKINPQAAGPTSAWGIGSLDEVNIESNPAAKPCNSSLVRIESTVDDSYGVEFYDNGQLRTFESDDEQNLPGGVEFYDNGQLRTSESGDEEDVPDDVEFYDNGRLVVSISPYASPKASPKHGQELGDELGDELGEAWETKEETERQQRPQTAVRADSILGNLLSDTVEKCAESRCSIPLVELQEEETNHNAASADCLTEVLVTSPRAVGAHTEESIRHGDVPEAEAPKPLQLPEPVVGDRVVLAAGIEEMQGLKAGVVATVAVVKDRDVSGCWKKGDIIVKEVASGEQRKYFRAEQLVLSTTGEAKLADVGTVLPPPSLVRPEATPHTPQCELARKPA
jgi:hypothetical protein